LRGLKHPPSSAPQDEASPLDDVAAGSVDGEPRPQLSPAGARDGNTGGTNEPQANQLLRRRRGDGQTERAEQKTVGGADEEERAVLAKVLERTELLDPRGAPRPGAFYILGALGTAEQAAYILRCTLWHLEHEKFSTALSSFTAGARERPDEWVLGFSSNPLTINYWDAIHPILRERGLKNTSVSALLGFRESIPVVTGESSRGQKDVLEFFARNPELLEHDFWELFWVDGLLYETYGHGRGDTVALVRLLTSHYAGFRDRVLDECLAAMRRDFRETRIFWVLYLGVGAPPVTFSLPSRLMISPGPNHPDTRGALTPSSRYNIGAGVAALGCAITSTSTMRFIVGD